MTKGVFDGTMIVRKVSETMVAPAEKTPSVTLSLSWMDVWCPSKYVLGACLVFNHDDLELASFSRSTTSSAASTVKNALSRALVAYFPVAGVLQPTSTDGDGKVELKVCCTGEGVWFVEAVADCSLEQVGFLDRLLHLPHDQITISNMEDLLPEGRPGLDDPTNVILMIQVTEFSCGGFVIGLKFNHAFFDGFGVSTFMKAVGDIVAGEREEFSSPNMRPVWRRDAIPRPPHALFPPPLPISVDRDMQFDILDFPLEHIKKLKTRFTESVQDGLYDDHAIITYCSAFDVVVAKFWKSRCRAIGLADLDVITHLSFVANMRRYILLGNKLQHEEGPYYGNCLYFGKISVPASKITRASIYEIVKLIHDAKEKMVKGYLAWIEGRGPAPHDGNYVEPPYEAAHVVDWTKIGLTEVDFGRRGGLPVNAFPTPARLGSARAACLLVKPPATVDKGVGVRLMMDCLKPQHLSAFVQEMLRDDDY